MSVKKMIGKTTKTDHSFPKKFGSTDMRDALAKRLGQSEHYHKPKNQRTPVK